MNIYAYHTDDKSRKLVHIDEWVVLYHPKTDGKCRICHEAVYVRAAASQKQTHFAHYHNSACPTVKENHKPYESLSSLPRDPSLALAAKKWLRDNIVNAYEKIRKFPDSLQWLEFHKLIDTANKLDIWSLKDMPFDCIPYVLLMCTEKFEKTKYRKRECFFVLEPSPEKTGLWNNNGFYKQYLWEVTLPSRDVIHHEIMLDTPTAWYIEKANKLLE